MKARPGARWRGVGAAFLRAPPPPSESRAPPFPAPTPQHAGSGGPRNGATTCGSRPSSELTLLQCPLAPHPPDREPAPCSGHGRGGLTVEVLCFRLEGGQEPFDNRPEEGRAEKQTPLKLGRPPAGVWARFRLPAPEPGRRRQPDPVRPGPELWVEMKAREVVSPPREGTGDQDTLTALNKQAREDSASRDSTRPSGRGVTHSKGRSDHPPC